MNSPEQFDPDVSFVENRSQPSGALPVSQVIGEIRSTKHAAAVAKVRALAPAVIAARAKVKTLKDAGKGKDDAEMVAVRAELSDAEKPWKTAKDALPAVTVSGVFPERETIKLHNPQLHSGCVQIDFDGKDNAYELGTLEKLKAKAEELRNDPHVVAEFLSPSGDGLKLFVRIPADCSTHERSFRALLKYFKDRYGLTADASTPNLNRLCYVSHDPEARFNPNAMEFAELAPEKVKRDSTKRDDKAASAGAFPMEEIRALLQRYFPERLEYDLWLKIANAVRSAVGTDAAIEMLQKHWPEEHPDEYEAKIEELSEVTAGTLFHEARQRGWSPTIYYQNKGDHYWARDSGGVFRSYNGSHAGKLLEFYRTPEGEIDAALMRVRLDECFDLALNVSGARRGIQRIDGRRVLVPEGPRLIEPAQGEWPVTRAILTGTFGGDGEQYRWLLLWLASSLRSLYAGLWQPAQVLAIIGPPATGKSLFQWFLTQLLGGRGASIIQAVTGGTEFNGDWAEAAHLYADDEFAENTPTIRARIKEHVKKLAVRSEHRIHPKGAQALMIEPFWRTTISCNPEPGSLAVLPSLEDSVRDKLSLLWTSSFTMPMPSVTGEEKAKLRAALMSEAPAFIFDMLALKDVPEKFRDPEKRFEVRSFHHPSALEHVDQMTTDGAIREQIFEFIRATGKPSFAGTAEELMPAFEGWDSRWSWLDKHKLAMRLALYTQSHPREFSTLTKSDSRAKKFLIQLPDFDMASYLMS